MNHTYHRPVLRVLSLLLAFALLICMTACGSIADSQLTETLLEAAGDIISAALAEDESTAPESQPTANSPPSVEAPIPEPTPEPEEELLPEDGTYTSVEDVSLYLVQYGRLPGNFITKKEAQALGWSGGSLEKYAPGKCIGGSRFGNYEKLLPDKQGRIYYECDIDTLGKKSRGAKRIVFSNDGLIYYTDDHYESFTLLYGEE